MKIRRETWDYRQLWDKRHPGRIERMFEDQLRRIVIMGTMIDQEEIVDNPEDLENCVQRRMMYLGTVFQVTPSGKFYTPFACSNVTIKEAALDEEWWEYMERELGKHNLSIESSEWDSCDLFLVRYYDIGEDTEWEREDQDRDWDGSGWDRVE